jgi:hypothetical protein
MNSLPIWVAWIIAIIAALTPGCLVLSARPIAQSLRLIVWPRSTATARLGPERARDEAAVSIPLG